MSKNDPPSLATDWSEELAPQLRAAFGLALALTGYAPAAEDLLQTAAQRVLTNPNSPINSFKAYLRASIVNAHIDQLRKLRNERAFLKRGTDDVLPDETYATDARIDIHRALAELSPLTRTVVVLRFLEDMTAESIGQLLGRPSGTIRRISHEGIRTLRSNGALTSYDPTSTKEGLDDE